MGCLLVLYVTVMLSLAVVVSHAVLIKQNGTTWSCTEVKKILKDQKPISTYESRIVKSLAVQNLQKTVKIFSAKRKMEVTVKYKFTEDAAKLPVKVGGKVIDKMQDVIARCPPETLDKDCNNQCKGFHRGDGAGDIELQIGTWHEKRKAFSGHLYCSCVDKAETLNEFCNSGGEQSIQYRK